VAGIDVAPAVPHQETAAQVYIVLARRVKKHAGTGLTAGAVFHVIMIADKDIVDGQGRCQFPVHGLDFGTGDKAASNVGLVGDDVKWKAVRLEFFQCRSGIWHDFEIVAAGWWKRLAVANEGAVEDAIAIEENRGAGLSVRGA
jgi:hypothetical protein